MKIFFSIMTSLLVLTLFGGCAKNISSTEYSEDEVGTVKQTYRGVILNVRNVKVNGSDNLGDNTMGLVGGGVGGALLGSQFGKGRGSVVGGVLGAVAGAVGGSMLEKKLKEQDGVEYTVELSSGRVMTLVQGPEPRLNPGQAVLVMVGSNGRSRVVADQSGGVSAVRAPTPVAYVPAPVVQQGVQQGAQQPQSYGPTVNDVDQGHRDLYSRDIAERSAGPRLIVQ